MEAINGLSSEVTFIVASRDVRVPFSVFEKNGIYARDLIAEAETLTPTVIINLSNVSYNTFKKIERFLINPEDQQPLLQTLKQVLEISDLVEICPPLEVICHAFIYQHLSPESALAILSNTDQLPDDSRQRFLVKLATDYATFKPVTTLDSDACLNMYTGDLKKCLDTFRDQPYQLFVTLMRRAKLEADKVGVPVRSVIFEFLSKIDFLSMTLKEFLAGPAESDVLNDSEKLSIMANIQSPGSLQLPDWCSTRRKRSGEQIFSIYTCKQAINYGDVVKSPFVSVVSFIPEDRDVLLVGVDFHSPRSIHTNTYVEAVVKISCVYASPFETRVPFPPKSTYLQIPGNVVIQKWSTCHLSISVNEPGVELFSCGRSNASQSKIRVAQNSFACSCNLSSGEAHIKKIYLQKR